MTHDSLDLIDVFNWNNNAIDQFSMRPDPNFGRSNVPPTIISIYEPKFLEIYMSYKRYLSCNESNVNFNNRKELSTQHLMSICLNNLIPFSNWARNVSNSAFIRSALFANPDMRPEVRNGLAMVLVYTFSAAKADASLALNHTMHNRGRVQQLQLSDALASAYCFLSQGANKELSDMFTVMSRQESGLGIVNKTSLKIYSDPFGFFAFIKVSLALSSSA